MNQMELRMLNLDKSVKPLKSFTFSAEGLILVKAYINRPTAKIRAQNETHLERVYFLLV